MVKHYCDKCGAFVGTTDYDIVHVKPDSHWGIDLCKKCYDESLNFMTENHAALFETTGDINDGMLR